MQTMVPCHIHREHQSSPEQRITVGTPFWQIHSNGLEYKNNKLRAVHTAAVSDVVGMVERDTACMQLPTLPADRLQSLRRRVIAHHT